MRRWGVVITVFYIVTLIVFLVPGVGFLAEGHFSALRGSLLALFGVPSWDSWQWLIWAWIFILVCGEMLLLFLSVDTSRQRLKPRTRIAISVLTTATLFTLLSSAAIFSVFAGFGEDSLSKSFPDAARVVTLFACLWSLWGFCFYLYFRSRSGQIVSAVSWLLRGSVLELLVAIPCHVIVRRRDDCCAPFVTGFGIATGIALMLLSFGPGVLLLYKKRLDAYREADRGLPGNTHPRNEVKIWT